jgi:protein-disulfide isomerase
MKYFLILFFAWYTPFSSAQVTSEQQQKIDMLIEQMLFNDPDSPRFGADKPRLTLVNFTDYNCPYCKQLDPMLEKIVQKYPQVTVVIKPLPFKGESSVLSARTVLTTWRLHPEQFQALHQKLMQKKGQHNAASVAMALEKSGASNITPDDKSLETLNMNLQLARLVGVQGTPATIIGDEMIAGAVSWEVLEDVVKEKLAVIDEK